MDTVTDVSANVVRQADGTLALRQYKIGDMAQGGYRLLYRRIRRAWTGSG